jgi:carbamoyltransferase
MIILGIHDGHNASACLMRNGELLAAAAEERYTRCKNEYGYPGNAIRKCLDTAGVALADIDRVAMGTRSLPPKYFMVSRNKNFTTADYWREQKEYWEPRIYGDGTGPLYTEIFADKIDLARIPYDWTLVRDENDSEGMLEARIRLVEKDLSIGRDRIDIHDHHTGHAAFGLHACGAGEKTLIFTADGFGDGTNATVWLADEQGRMTELKRTNQCNIGRIYRYITLLLGMKQNEHEYKVMGLAPYANEYLGKGAYEVFRETLRVDGLDFTYGVRPKDHFFHFRDRLQEMRFDGIAWGLQRWVEELLCEWILNGVRQTGVRRVVFSGGVALNIKANMHIGQLDEIDSFYVPPAPGDESLCIGAACLSQAMHAGSTGRTGSIIDSLYLGNSYGDEEIRQALDEYEHLGKCTLREAKPETVAEILASGEIVARFGGRMEFGPRALGNRSIMANPSLHESVRKINEFIKKRDFWMPFTPSILAERIDDYIINPKSLESRYMILAFNSTPLAAGHLAAALHAYDKTARPQRVEKSTNPEYHAIISAFERLTGIGAVLNTSFNIHGDPIVESPQDALHTFSQSGLDHLVLGKWLLSKKDKGGQS